MNEKNKSKEKGLLYNNKFLVIFSIVVAIVTWAVVKVNYSEKITRTVSDVSISFDNILKDTDYVPYLSNDITVNVTVSGKSYNISSNALNKDDIIVEPVNLFVDSTGYKYVTLSARFADTSILSTAEITKVSPSSIKVFFDRQVTDTFNVEAKLLNSPEDLVDGEYITGQAVPSINVIKITGPATVLSNIPCVYFEAEVNESELPLTVTKEVPATVKFDLENEEFVKFLSYTDYDEQTNPATVTIPVYVTKEVPTELKFIGQPANYLNKSPDYSVSPSKVTVSYNPQDIQKMESFLVGTIDFKEISNTKNKFTFKVDETMNTTLVNKDITEFTVNVDMSSMSSKVPEATPTKTVITGKVDGYDYSVSINNNFFQNIKIIGPETDIEEITSDELQVEINVSSLDVNNSNAQQVDVSNISIQSTNAKNCWIYGSCTATVTITKQ